MTNGEGAAAAYEVVLGDLRAKRAQIDAAIAAIEALSGAPASQSAPPDDGASRHADGPGDCLGMSIPDAAKRLLAKRRKSMGNVEIAKALRDGGLVLASADPANTIGSVLTRRFHQVGDIVRVDRGTWGLKEWYPNRSFARKNGDVSDAQRPEPAKTNGDPTAPEQPSEQQQIAALE